MNAFITIYEHYVQRKCYCNIFIMNLVRDLDQTLFSYFSLKVQEQIEVKTEFGFWFVN